jgi:SAM-dependent methyltransferase
MSFGLIAEDYNRLRPGSPDEAVDWLVPARCAVAVDLGAGTGLLTRKLMSRAGRVIAIEPDDRMSAVLRDRSPGVEVIKGTAEAIPLPDASADGVFVSSAWHWMDPDLAIPEICRVLRDGGRFGVVWSGRDRQVSWLQDIDGLPGLRSPAGNGSGSPAAPGQAEADPADTGPAGSDPADTGPTASGPAVGGPADTGPAVGGPAVGGPAVGGLRPRRREVQLPEDGLFNHVETASFGFTRAMTVDAIVALLATYSGLISASLADRAAALARARAALSQRFPGAREIDVPMRASCWRADRAPRG